MRALDEGLLGLGQHPGQFERGQFNSAARAASIFEQGSASPDGARLCSNSFVCVEHRGRRLRGQALSFFSEDFEFRCHLGLDLVDHVLSLSRVRGTRCISRLVYFDLLLDGFDAFKQFHLAFF